VADPTNQRIEDELIARQVLLERYQRGLVLRVISILERAEEDILSQIIRMDPSSIGAPAARQARLARLLVEVQARIEQYATELSKGVVPELGDLAKDEAAFGVRILNELPPVVLDVVVPSTSVLLAVVTSRPFQGRLLREWVREHPAAVRMRLRNAIRMGVAQGETIDQIIRRIRGTRANSFKDGVLEVNRRGAEAMVRTAVSHTVASAREATYDANSDIIKGVRWVSTLDSRTSIICQGLDGQVFPVNKGPRPPAHVNCRSTTVPILKSWRELGIVLGEAPEGTRASMDGQVPASQTYQQWLGKRSAAFQDEVLGPTRAALFRRGGLTLDKFTDSSGHIYTLAELRRRAPKSFSRAGLE